MVSTLDTSLAITGLIFFYLSRFRNFFHPTRIVLILILYGALALYWFNLNGMHGSMAVAAIAIGLTSIVMADSSSNRIHLVFSFLLICVLVGIQVFTPLITTAYVGIRPVPYLIFVVAIFMVVYYLKSQYDKERKITTQQYLDLKEKSELLERTIHEKEEFIRQLDRTRDQLLESEKMASVGRIVGGLAHEINNPLNFVGGSIHPVKLNFSELKESLGAEAAAKNQEVLDEIDSLLSNIEEGSRRAANVVESLLKISPRSLSGNKVSVDLREMLQGTILLFENLYGRSEIELTMEEEVTLVANAAELNQALINLLKNAFDATETCETRYVTIRATHQDGHCLIDIQDNGPGISPQNLTSIFDPFFTTKSEGEGLGLGLYIAYSIVKKHGGSLTALPVSHGACLRMVLPVVS